MENTRLYRQFTSNFLQIHNITYTAYILRKHVFVGYSQKLVYLKYFLNFVQLTWYWKNRNTFDRKQM